MKDRNDLIKMYNDWCNSVGNDDEDYETWIERKLLSSLQSKGKTSAEEFLRDKYKLVDFHDLTLNGKPWVELMEEYAQSHAKPNHSGKTKEEVWEEVQSYHQIEGTIPEGSRVETAVYVAMERFSNQQPEANKDGWVRVETAKKLLAIRDALLKEDIDEAYHQLRMIADPKTERNDHWKIWEEIVTP